VAKAYNRDLRNAIGHNNYTWRYHGSRVYLEDLYTGRTWELQDVNHRTNAMLEMVYAVQTIMACSAWVDRTRHPWLAEAGFTSFAFMTAGRPGVPQLLLLQLWCFHELDAEGRWLDDATLTLEPGEPGEEIVRLTKHAYSRGRSISGTAFQQALERVGWVQVTRVPVAPHLGLGLPSYRRPDGVEYELVGPPNTHIIPYKPNS
jgi:hypothetical protein